MQIAMECLDPWTKNLEAMIKAKHGTKKLRQSSSLQTFEELVLDVTDDYTRLAVAARQAQLRTNPREKAEIVRASVEERRLQRALTKVHEVKKEVEVDSKASPETDLARINAQHREGRYHSRERK